MATPGPAELPPSPPSPCFLYVDSDPSNSDHYALVLIPELAKKEGWLSGALAKFPLCGVCRARAPCDVQLSATWRVFDRFAVAGFVSCAEDACVRIAQLRADTRREGFRVMASKKLLTTPESVVKACAYCAALREQVQTFICGRCRTVRYCNHDCQRAHWYLHRDYCVLKETV